MFDYTNLAYAYGQPLSTGNIKTTPEDFKVDEILGFEPTGEGEHLFLLIEKRGINTEELVKELATLTNLSPKLISYAGLKDRQALTTQWVGLHCPGQDIPEANSFSGKGWRVIESKRHSKKLKTGGLSGNAFQLILRDVKPDEALEKRLHHIQTLGVPNYFGNQRFGYGGQNLMKAQRLLEGGYKIKDRFLRGMYYSAARSFLFNCILSERVKQNNWNQALAGDVMQLGGTKSVFTLETPDDVIKKRVEEFDISPAGVLWGYGENKATAQALAIQQEMLLPYEKWCDGLIKQKLELAYRPFILQVKDLAWQREDDNLLVKFKLPAGSYATSVVRELVLFDLTKN